MKALIRITYTVPVEVTDAEYRALDEDIDVSVEDDLIQRALDAIREDVGLDGREEEMMGWQE